MTNTVTVEETVVTVTETGPSRVAVVREPIVETVQIGISGPQGAQGPQGPQGPSGQGTTSGETWTQGVAASTWNVTHSLGYYPNVTVVDSAGTTVEGDVSYPSLTQVTLTFNGAFSGVAYLS